jgi:hypothetical protein
MRKNVNERSETKTTRRTDRENGEDEGGERQRETDP